MISSSRPKTTAAGDVSAISHKADPISHAGTGDKISVDSVISDAIQRGLNAFGRERGLNPLRWTLVVWPDGASSIEGTPLDGEDGEGAVASWIDLLDMTEYVHEVSGHRTWYLTQGQLSVEISTQ